MLYYYCYTSFTNLFIVLFYFIYFLVYITKYTDLFYFYIN